MTPSLTDRLLCFSVGSREYAISLKEVLEVFALPEVTPVPFTPDFFLGIMNLRGRVLSVLDLRKRFKVQSSAVNENTVILWQKEGVTMGFLVDSVNAVVAVNAQQQHSSSELSMELTQSYVECVCQIEGSLVLVLDLLQLLRIPEGADPNHFNQVRKKHEDDTVIS